VLLLLKLRFRELIANNNCLPRPELQQAPEDHDIFFDRIFAATPAISENRALMEAPIKRNNEEKEVLESLTGRGGWSPRSTPTTI